MIFHSDLWLLLQKSCPLELYLAPASVDHAASCQAGQTAPRVRSILTNISKNSSWLTSLGETCVSRLAAVRGGGMMETTEESEARVCLWSDLKPRYNQQSNGSIAIPNSVTVLTRQVSGGGKYR